MIWTKTQYLFTGERLGKNVFKETDAMIQRHNEVLDNLMQQFRDKMAITAVENIHRIGTINFKFSSSLV
jgi:molybdopterin synthase catalytic subunit